MEKQIRKRIDIRNSLFNWWRLNYARWADSDHVNFCNQIEEYYPEQLSFTPAWVELFFEKVTTRVKKESRVMEIGGWKGELAASILPQFPQINVWENYEICKICSEKTVCEDPRYRVHTSETFRWWEAESCTAFNIVVASHVFEHMSGDDLTNLTRIFTHIEFLYVEIPVLDDTQDETWFGYGGTHKLEIGWKQVHEILARVGLRPFYETKRKESPTAKWPLPKAVFYMRK